MNIERVSPEQAKPDKVRLIMIDKLGHAALVNVGNCLMFPGGKIESEGGETSREALDREILEETGISIDDENCESLFTIEAKFENYPSLVGDSLRTITRQTEYFRLFLPEIKFGKQDLTNIEKIGKLSVNLAVFADLPKIINEHESENPYWPFHKKELKFVLSELDKQGDNV